MSLRDTTDKSVGPLIGNTPLRSSFPSPYKLLQGNAGWPRLAALGLPGCLGGVAQTSLWMSG